MNGTTNDHDLLIELNTIIKLMRDDLKELKLDYKEHNVKLATDLAARNKKCDDRCDECEKKFVAIKDVKVAKGVTAIIGSVAAVVVTAFLWVLKAVFGIGG